MTSLPLKWHGGKHYIAKQIIALFPPRDSYVHYVEPFFGGGSVLFEHDSEGKSEVVNDLNGELTNFWSVLQSPVGFAQMRRDLENIPLSINEFDKAQATLSEPVESSVPVDRAVAFFIRYRQSRQGLGKDFATLSRNRTRRGMNEQASSWQSAIDGLPEAHARLKRVVILNSEAGKVICQQDGDKTVFYCDPPYLHETRKATDAYECEMSAVEHESLLQCLSRINGRFLLSGYPSRLYDHFAEAYKWRRVDIQIDNKASSAKTKEIKTECVWLNYSPGNSQ